ncbi:MAG: transcription-repair coupling factor, partial [Deltaproteobacteria bacterium]|nr:transcription-repair coupling factor [Deltaproteobacteria bacterium]
GNLLGHAQSGKIDAVGMDMYLELLSEAMTELKGEKVPPKIDPEVNLNIPACIPEEYVADINQRLVLYRRMASITSDEEVEDMEAELNDRFGRLPEQVATLLEVARIKNLLRGFLVVSVDFAQRQLVFSFHEEAEQSLERILTLVASDQQRFRFTPDLKLFANVKGDGGEGLLQEIGEMLG